jgi:hypothetical protein
MNGTTLALLQPQMQDPGKTHAHSAHHHQAPQKQGNAHCTPTACLALAGHTAKHKQDSQQTNAGCWPHAWRTIFSTQCPDTLQWWERSGFHALQRLQKRGRRGLRLSM